MPIYEYRCDKCNLSFEKLQNIRHRKTPACPKCKKEDKVERKITAPNVHFKGRGWTPQFHGMVNGGQTN